MNKVRCSWCGDDPLYVNYHDQEWGIPIYDDKKLFEMLMLEGAQAGLSWITVLKKRENYRKAFFKFNINKIAGMTDEQLEEQLQNPGIIRNKLKVYGLRKNALAYQNNFKKKGEFSEFIWSFVDGETIANQWADMSEVPGFTEHSDKMSRSLKKMGFTFVGSTICYAFMQAAGLVNDHLVDCFRYKS